MDWSFFIEHLSAIIALLATVIASVTALWGINAWKREHVGKSTIDLTEKVLELAYQIQEQIESIQSPLSFGDEGISRPKSPEETPAEQSVLNATYVMAERFEKCRPIFAELYALRFRCKIRLGSECSNLIEDLWQIRHEFSKPLRRLHRRVQPLKRPGNKMSEKERENAIVELYHEEIERYDEQAISDKAAKIILQLEQVCHTALKKPC